ARIGIDSRRFAHAGIRQRLKGVGAAGRIQLEDRAAVVRPADLSRTVEKSVVVEKQRRLRIRAVAGGARKRVDDGHDSRRVHLEDAAVGVIRASRRAGAVEETVSGVLDERVWAGRVALVALVNDPESLSAGRPRGYQEKHQER